MSLDDDGRFRPFGRRRLQARDGAGQGRGAAAARPWQLHPGVAPAAAASQAPACVPATGSGPPHDRRRLWGLQLPSAPTTPCPLLHSPTPSPRAHVPLTHSPPQYEYLKRVGQPEAYQGSWVERLNQAGYSVTGIDLPGHGRSDGLHGYVNSFQEDLIDTVVQAAR